MFSAPPGPRFHDHVNFSAKYDVFAPRSRKHSAHESPDADFDEAAPASAEADFAAFTREVELARKAAAGHSLDESFFHTHRQADMNLRWVFVHMIEEYARHNGHADLLRECIDGTTGD